MNLTQFKKKFDTTEKYNRFLEQNNIEPINLTLLINEDYDTTKTKLILHYKKVMEAMKKK